MALWWATKDGDHNCLPMYEKHYSAYQYRDGRKRTQFVGPGEHLVLRTDDYDAFFVWRRFIDRCVDERTGKPQEGINCAVFQNNGQTLSSTLIRAADEIADAEWLDKRHYTYVNPKAVRSQNPGFCFIKAGWRKCGVTKGGLLVLERITDTTDATNSSTGEQQ